MFGKWIQIMFKGFLICMLVMSSIFLVDVSGAGKAEKQMDTASGFVQVTGNEKIYVNGLDGDDNNNGESEAGAFRTIYKAVEKARTAAGDSVDILVSGDVSVPDDLVIDTKKIIIKGINRGRLNFLKTLTINSSAVFEDICLDFKGNTSSEHIKVHDTYVKFAESIDTKGKPNILYEETNSLQIWGGSFHSVKDSGRRGELELYGGTIETADGWSLITVSPEPNCTVTVNQGIQNVNNIDLQTCCRNFIVNGNINAGQIKSSGADTSICLLSGKKIEADSFDPNILLVILPENGVTKTGEYLACKRINSIHAKAPAGYYFIIQDNGDHFSAMLRVNLSSVSISPSSCVLTEGEKISLKAVFTPEAAQTIYTVSWTSSNPAAASVDAHGNITAHKAGNTVITAAAMNDASKRASCQITVLQKIYRIEYVLNGGTNSRQNPSSFAKPGFELKKPYRKGYRFDGWYTDRRMKIPLKTIRSKKDITIYAKWTKIAVSRPKISSLKNTVSGKLLVTYSNIRNISGYEIVCSKNRKFTAIIKTVSTRAFRKTLTGFKSKAGYYVKVRAYKYDSKGDRVYSAYSSVCIGNSIKYHLKKGRNSGNNLIRYYKTTAKLKNPSRKGYRFKGWYTNKKCTKRIRVVSKNKHRNYNLYAKWKKR